MKTARARRNDPPTALRVSNRVKPQLTLSDDVSTAIKSEDAEWDRLPRIFLAFAQDLNAGRKAAARPDPASKPLFDGGELAAEVRAAIEPAESKPLRAKRRAAQTQKASRFESQKQRIRQTEFEAEGNATELAAGGREPTNNASHPSNPTPHSYPHTEAQKMAGLAEAAGGGREGEGAFGAQLSLAQLVDYLNYCYSSQILKPEQLWALNEMIVQQARPEQLWALNEMLAQRGGQGRPAEPAAVLPPLENALGRSESGEKDYPANCMHVRACYFIWDRQNKGVVDPTELGRKYKELYFAVS